MFDSCLKIQILIYAYDTVIFSESPEGLQKSLNCLAEYCKRWKLSINIEKTEFFIFSKARYTGNFNFKLNGENISIVDSFKGSYIEVYYRMEFSKHDFQFNYDTKCRVYVAILHHSGLSYKMF